MVPSYRTFADSSKDLPVAPADEKVANELDADKSHNMHVSEEAAKTADILGTKGPDIQQGTPVEEVRCEGARSDVPDAI